MQSKTSPHRTNNKIKKPTTTRTMTRSKLRMNHSLPAQAEANAQGINARQPIARTVPTALACSECHTSPRIKRAKLLVMPHDGQGKPVTVLKVHGGSPNCRCVSS